MKTRLAALMMLTLALAGCTPEPKLHLFDAQPTETQLLFAELDLDVYWDYETENGTRYDWRKEWFYGWDDEDRRLFGEIGYTRPTSFSIRRYPTGDLPYTPHVRVIPSTIEGNIFQGYFTYGFWDMLVFNDIKLVDGVQSLHFDETTTLDSITVFTNESMSRVREETGYTHAFYQPEELFSAYEQAIEINRSLDGFVFDEERNAYVKKLNMVLRPVTYIYLTQVIIHHNNGRIVGVEGSGHLSGFGRSSVLNSGRAGKDAVSVYHFTRLKRNCEKAGEQVDIVGGRLLTFGICGQRSGHLSNSREVRDAHRHYMDLKMLFNNGTDSTFVFDVTDQVRQRYKGGVLTVELDLDTIPLPSRSGGSAFDAVVKDFEEETHEIEM